MAQGNNEDDIVVFEDANGNEISNDPRWKARKTLAQSGDVPSNDFSALQQQLADAQARIAELEGDLENDDEEDKDADGNRTYKELDGKGLKALAGERDVDIKGLKSVGDVRKALIADDAAKAAE